MLVLRKSHTKFREDLKLEKRSPRIQFAHIFFSGPGNIRRFLLQVFEIKNLFPHTMKLHRVP